MSKVELRRPYKLSELIEIASKDFWAVNPGGMDSKCLCPDTGLYDLDLYTNKFEELLFADLICFLEEPSEVTDEDEEIFPDFVLQEGLVPLYAGDMFESVIEAAFYQKLQPSMKEFIDSLNYYREYDSFLDL